jgi:hypothetical protein
MNACRRYYATGGLVNVSDLPDTSVLPALGAPVRLEKCVFEKDTPLRGQGLNCGSFMDFGTITLVRGMPFDFAYQQPGAEFNRMVMITKQRTPSQVSQSLEAAPRKEIGLDLGLDTPEGEAYRASGACENPPRLIFGWPHFVRDIKRAWASWKEGYQEKHGDGPVRPQHPQKK